MDGRRPESGCECDVTIVVFAVVALEFANPIWFHTPWCFTLMHAGFDLGNWILAGLVLAAFVRREA